MKKLIIKLPILFLFLTSFLFFSCQKEIDNEKTLNNNKNIALSPGSGEKWEATVLSGSTLNLLQEIEDTTRVRIINDGETDLLICVAEDDITVCSDGVIIKSGGSEIIIAEELGNTSERNFLNVTNLSDEIDGYLTIGVYDTLPDVIGKTISISNLNYDDPIYVSFRESEGYQQYNETKWGALNLESAELHVFEDNREAVFIPFENNIANVYEGGINGFFQTDGDQFFTYVIEYNWGENITYFKEFTGGLKLYLPEGEYLSTTTIDNNLIIDVDDGDPGASGPCDFNDCYTSSVGACSDFWLCDMINSFTNVVTAGAALCCAIHTGMDCQGNGC